MKHLKLITISAAAVLLCIGTAAKEIDFNEGWEFSRDSLATSRTVNLPHDFSMEASAPENDAAHIGPFSAESPNSRALGYLTTGTAWYRKHFTVSASDKKKRFSLLFDGAYMETDVIVNGQTLASHKNGYTPFFVDITPALKPAGQDNEIIVTVRNIGRNTRWYSGSGLYRDVKLVVTEPTHIAQWGVYVTTPKIETSAAEVSIEVKAINDNTKQAASKVSVTIIDPHGKALTSCDKTVTLAPNSSEVVDLTATVGKPELWSVDSPSLYTASVTLFSGKGKILDTCEQKFGIRSISCDAVNGLLVNGEQTLLKGGCVHHDNGILGAVALKTAEYRRVRLLKESGYNAVRCAHNPPSKYFLDACDELGLLVMDEFTDMWEQPKNTDDYSRFFIENWESDLEAMLLRDRNHPSIIFWSIGNEVPNWSIADASRIGKQLSDKVREMDPTRLVTQGITGAYIHLEWDNSQYTFQHLDVSGYNYLRNKYDSDHEKFPDRVIICTESYPNQSYAYWKDVVDKPYVIGDFVWTALEHIGEAGCGSARYVDESTRNRRPGGMPDFQSSMGPQEGRNPAMMWAGGGGNATFVAPGSSSSANPAPPVQMRLPNLPSTYVNWCGDVDLVGYVKPQGLYRRVMWDVSPVEMVVHEPIPVGMVETMNQWGWPNEQAHWYFPGREGQCLQVRVFSKASRVRLELNGEVVGIADTDDNLVAMFDSVAYVPGKLVAVTLDKDGKEIDSKVFKTPGKPHSVRVSRETNNIDNDIVYLKLEVVDADGAVVPDKFPLTLDIKGAEFVASGNGAPNDMASFRSESPSTYLGNAVIIVRPESDEIVVTASSEGLVSGKAQFTSDGKDIIGKDFGVGLCSVQNIGSDFEDSIARIAATGVTHIEMYNFNGGRMLGMAPEEVRAIADRYGLRIISDLTMGSAIDTENEDAYLQHWEEVFTEDAILGVKYVSMTANMFWGDKTHVLECCKILNKIGALARNHGIQFLYHMHNIEFNPIVGSEDGEQIIDVVMANTDPEMVKFQGDVFWIQIGGKDPAKYIKEHAARIPMLHVKDFYFIGEGDYIDYKSVFEAFYGAGHTDWVLEMEPYMTREEMYKKAEGHNRMSQTREMPRFGAPQPRPQADQAASSARQQRPLDKSAAADRNRARIKSILDIERNVKTLKTMSFIPETELQ